MSKVKSCDFVPLDGFYTHLEASLCDSDRWLHLADDLSEYLPKYGNWTTLAVYDGKLMEVVRAHNMCGYIVFDRAFEGTRKYRFPRNAYVEFIMTKIGVASMVCCDKWFENCEKEV